MTRIAIGVPTYNGAARLGWLLKSLAMRTPEIESGEAEIVVVDDGSPRREETRSVIRAWEGKLPIRYLEHDGNRGISAGWNTLSRATDAPVVALLNDDVIVPSGGWLRALSHVVEKSPGVGSVGANMHWFLSEDADALTRSPDSDRSVTPRDHEKRHAPERREMEACTDVGGGCKLKGNPGRVMCPTGQMFAFRRSDFETVGGFDERMKSFYEESSFGTELAARGMITAILNWPFCWHMWSATFRENPELDAGRRIAHSRSIYRERWAIPESVHAGREFDYTNPKYLGAIGDVEIQFVRRNGEVWRGVLRRDGSFVDGQKVEQGQ